MNKGVLYLIPVPIHSENEFDKNFIPPYIIEIINNIKVFAVENIRTSRRFIKKVNKEYDIDNTEFIVIDKRANESVYNEIINNLIKGNNIGVMSESGCPGIADPGQRVCELAHQNNIKIKPLIGPSSIITALMSSGLNGQEFKFHGYLPIDQKERINKIKKLSKEKGSHIFIETPYRNQKVLNDFIGNLIPNKKICIATDITGKNEKIITKKISEFYNSKMILEKYPTIFIFE
jgi:16S rRNA (cytidine1402-2'-O)-methyltransferase